MPFIFPTILKDDLVEASALQENNFAELFKAANDPIIWEQHPNKNRYKQEEFSIYFEGAIKETTAFLVRDMNTKEVIGCSRYYDYNELEKKITIGYTFFITKCWGKEYNKRLKKLMIDYAFQFVDTIIFVVGAVNKRSQIAVERLGATKVKEQTTAYYGEQPKLDFIYHLNKAAWKF